MGWQETRKKREQCRAVKSFPAEQKHFRAKDVRDETLRHMQVVLTSCYPGICVWSNTERNIQKSIKISHGWIFKCMIGQSSLCCLQVAEKRNSWALFVPLFIYTFKKFETTFKKLVLWQHLLLLKTFPKSKIKMIFNCCYDPCLTFMANFSGCHFGLDQRMETHWRKGHFVVSDL